MSGNGNSSSSHNSLLVFAPVAVCSICGFSLAIMFFIAGILGFRVLGRSPPLGGEAPSDFGLVMSVRECIHLGP